MCDEVDEQQVKKKKTQCRQFEQDRENFLLFSMPEI
jgi:hypothetical protein